MLLCQIMQACNMNTLNKIEAITQQKNANDLFESEKSVDRKNHKNELTSLVNEVGF